MRPASVDASEENDASGLRRERRGRSAQLCRARVRNFLDEELSVLALAHPLFHATEEDFTAKPLQLLSRGFALFLPLFRRLHQIRFGAAEDARERSDARDGGSIVRERAIPAQELDPRPPFEPLEAADHDGPNLGGRPGMGAAAGLLIVALDLDDAEGVGVGGGLPQIEGGSFRRRNEVTPDGERPSNGFVRGPLRSSDFLLREGDLSRSMVELSAPR